MNIYNTVPAARLKRSMFHWKVERNQTQDFGAIVPFFIREVLPGDVWKIKQSNFIRVQPMVSAPFTPLRFYSEFWFCPTRVLMQKLNPEIVDAWETFIFGGDAGDGKNEAGQTPTLPLWVPNASGVKLAGINVSGGVQSRKTGNADAKGSLWDYFGFPVNTGYHSLDDDGLDANNVDYSEWLPLAFPKIMYNLIWNEFKRNENLESKVDLMSDDIQLCKWKHDYFTSSLPFQQRGNPVALPLGSVFTNFETQGMLPAGYAGVQVNGGTTMLNAVDPALMMYGNGTLADKTQGGYSTTSFSVGNEQIFVSNKDQSLGSRTKAYTISSGVTGSSTSVNYPLLTNAQTDVSDLRLMFQTQKWLERVARGGARYIEGLKAFFGTSPRADVLQLPTFLGGMKQNIIVNEVLQTSETGTTPQGNIAGRGISAAGDFIATYAAKEHGFIMGICWIKPDLYYASQGIRREFLRRSRYDYFWSQFAHLSERPIFKAELFASPSTMTPSQLGAGSEGILGYTGIYNEYRSSWNEICGEMRDTFKYWHLAREFSSAPTLGADFVNCFPRKDIFAVQDEDEFLLDILTDVKVWRPIPIESDPGLIDHF